MQTYLSSEIPTTVMPIASVTGVAVSEPNQLKSKILIVDDTPVGREMLESLLYSSNYDLAFAEDGAEALEKAQLLKPDIILLDVMMPGMDGFEVCRRVRANPELAEVPVILVTALDDRASRLNGIEAGADDFITKPIDRAEMRARVRTITRLNRFRRMIDERARFSWVVEQSEDGYVLIDQEDAILYANASARRLLGLDADLEAITKNFLDAARRRYRLEPEVNWLNWPLTNHKEDLGAYLRPQGASADVLFLIRPESSAAPASWLQVSVLRPKNSTVGEQLIRMHDVTAQMSNRRDMFTFHSLVMHKLNTPLHLMLASMELLRADRDSYLLSAQSAELLELALGGALRLRGVVDDILRFLSVPSLADSSRHFDITKLPGLVKILADNMELTQVQVQVQSHITERTALVWTERIMEMVMSELLQNSRKFHPKQTPNVLIVAEVNKPWRNKRGSVTIQVSDDGITLTPEQLAQVWSPYYQGERYFTGEIPGMGLGLAMVASLVWEVDGAYRLYNRPDGPGVIVELTIPLEELDQY